MPRSPRQGILRSIIERSARALNPEPVDETHLRVLRLLESNPEMSQRELAKALGVSLGKTHYLLKALLQRGLVKANNFRRSDNKLAYAYVLTGSGFAAKIELAKAFLRRKESEFLVLRDEIDRLRSELREGPRRNGGSQA